MPSPLRPRHKPSNQLRGGHDVDATIVAFSVNDPDDPDNWSTRKKTFVVFVGILAVLNSTLDSALPSNAIAWITAEFGVNSDIETPLPISLYLVGYILGPLLFGPLSETYGRRIVMIPTYLLFIVFTLATALAPTWPLFLVFRLVCGTFASSPIAITGGIYADIYHDPRARGRVIAMFITATAIGPQFAPLISGYVSPVGWRWAFWIGLIIAAVSFIPIIFLPETYPAVILRKRAERMRREDPKLKAYAPTEMEHRNAKEIVTVILARPLRMLFTESIVFFSCLYLSFATALYFLFFEAYALIFQGIYSMSAGTSGLAFVPMIIGALIALAISLLYDSYLSRARRRHAPWTAIEEYRRLPLACLGGPLYPISLFWLGWTANPTIHWIVPMLAGLVFGIGFVLIFMSLLNYMADAYREYAASAAAAASCSRSVFGAVLPLAAPAMYKGLGIGWGNGLLAFLSLGLCGVPFALIRWGGRIREGSRFSRDLVGEKTEGG